jgi:hypothetical protein
MKKRKFKILLGLAVVVFSIAFLVLGANALYNVEAGRVFVWLCLGTVFVSFIWVLFSLVKIKKLEK